MTKLSKFLLILPIIFALFLIAEIALAYNHCQCTSGACCDGCNFRPSNVVCNSENTIEYCASGGFNISKTRVQYCSGYSSQCDGTWSNWQKGAECVTTPTPTPRPDEYAPPGSTYVKYYAKKCKDNDLYWYDSNNKEISLFESCDDKNLCTADTCQDGECKKELKCDIQICPVGSEDYCKVCKHTEDKICNCGENPTDNPQECALFSAGPVSNDNQANQNNETTGEEPTSTEAVTNPALSILSNLSASPLIDFAKKWYIWVIGAIVLVVLFIVIFKRLSSEV